MRKSISKALDDPVRIKLTSETPSNNINPTDALEEDDGPITIQGAPEVRESFANIQND